MLPSLSCAAAIPVSKGWRRLQFPLELCKLWQLQQGYLRMQLLRFVPLRPQHSWLRELQSWNYEQLPFKLSCAPAVPVSKRLLLWISPWRLQPLQSLLL